MNSTEHTWTARISLALCLGFAVPLPQDAVAEPVEIRHDGGVGAGYTFRRGTTCTVLTAEHVIRDAAGLITVLDRSGAKAAAQPAYANEAYDLALLSLPDDTAVACTSAWPDVAPLKAARFSSKTQFEAVRHYPDGRETLVLLRYAGGTPQRFELAPVDKLRIVESDSGSIVMLDGAPAGIVQAVVPEEDRVQVLRFDTIDQLVGDRFRSVDATGALSFAGVFQNGRRHANWSTYIEAWLLQRAGRSIVPAGDPAARCDLRVEVLDWQRKQGPNPQYATVENQLKMCGKNGWVWEQMCSAGRKNASTTPKTVPVHTLMLNVEMTPAGAATLSKLASGDLIPPPGLGASGSQVELAVLQSGVASVAEDLFKAGGCN